jgi:hypothetical protein
MGGANSRMAGGLDEEQAAVKLIMISWDPIVKYIKDQHSAYLRKELTAQRERYMDEEQAAVNASILDVTLTLSGEFLAEVC